MEIDMIWARAIASVAVCTMGTISAYLTKDKAEPTGVGYAILGVFLIWFSA